MLLELPQRKEFPISQLSAISGYEQVKVSRMRWVSELNAAIELERQRLARDLHDQMGQELIALTLGVRSLKKELCPTSALRIQLEGLQEIIGRLNQQVHDIAWELRPLILDDLGLKEALLMLLEKLAEHTNIKNNLRGIELSDLKLPKSAEIEVYRIIQEALTNIAKHAGAGNVEITLKKLKNNLSITIIDDGCGFDIAAVNSDMQRKCYGLIGMQERVALLSGALSIITSPGNGTMLKINLPVYC